MQDKNKSKPMATIVASKCYEGFPMSIVESYKNCIPIVCSNVGNAKLLVKNEKTGLHFNINDINSLINAVSDFEFLSLNKNAYNEYVNKYTDVLNYIQLKKIYNNLI